MLCSLNINSLGLNLRAFQIRLSPILYFLSLSLQLSPLFFFFPHHSKVLFSFPYSMTFLVCFKCFEAQLLYNLCKRTLLQNSELFWFWEFCYNIKKYITNKYLALTLSLIKIRIMYVRLSVCLSVWCLRSW